jgi:hypothetical protein
VAAGHISTLKGELAKYQSRCAAAAHAQLRRRAAAGSRPCPRRVPPAWQRRGRCWLGGGRGPGSTRRLVGCAGLLTPPVRLPPARLLAAGPAAWR